jgi:hypothetical protein
MLLRLEQENCLDRHNPDSCLFPIPQGVALPVHGVRWGSDEQPDQPDDLTARWLLNAGHDPWGMARQFNSMVDATAPFESEYDIRKFPDIAGAWDSISTIRRGCILDDFDNDDLIDVVDMLTSCGSFLAMYRPIRRANGGQA